MQAEKEEETTQPTTARPDHHRPPQHKHTHTHRETDLTPPTRVPSIPPKKEQAKNFCQYKTASYSITTQALVPCTLSYVCVCDDVFFFFFSTHISHPPSASCTATECVVVVVVQLGQTRLASPSRRHRLGVEGRARGCTCLWWPFFHTHIHTHTRVEQLCPSRRRRTGRWFSPHTTCAAWRISLFFVALFDLFYLKKIHFHPSRWLCVGGQDTAGVGCM